MDDDNVEDTGGAAGRNLAKQQVTIELFLQIEHYQQVMRALNFENTDAANKLRNSQRKAACGLFGQDEAGEDTHEDREVVDLNMPLVHLVEDTMVLWENRVGDLHILRSQRRKRDSCCHTLDTRKSIRKIPVNH